MPEHQEHAHTSSANPGRVDPVCGMTVKESTAALKSEHKGATYFFCSRGCKVAFEKDPATYLKGGPQMRM